MENYTKIIKIFIIVIAVLFISVTSIFFVDEGERVVVLRFGEITKIANTGLNFKLPIFDKKISFEIRTQKYETDSQSASKDLQDVSTTIAVQFNIQKESVGEIYKQYGVSYKERIITPAIQEAVKSSTAKFTASELITERPKVKEEIKNYLKLRLSEAYINVSNIDIVNFNFSDSFNQAIEEKVKAQQDALKEKNRLEKIKYQAEQKITIAKAEAEKIRLEAIALKENPLLIEKIKADIQLEAIKRWDGKLPTTIPPNASVPFINIK